jgi:anti-sigma factor RsiW
MNCNRVRERMSEYLDGLLDRVEESGIRQHLAVCPDCRSAEEDMQAVIRWGRAFPQFAPPEWLLARIMAQTPRVGFQPQVQKETWSDTLATLAGWIRQGWGPAAVCATVVCLVWTLTAIPLAPLQSDIESPMVFYYRLDRFFGSAYDQAVRIYQRAPIVNEIQIRIDQIRESSG